MTAHVVFGAGGHGKVVADAISSRGGEVLAFIDDDPRRVGSRVLGIEVRSSDWLFASDGPTQITVALGVGDNHARQRIAVRCRDGRRGLATVIHPAATVAASARLGQGTYVAARAVINADATVGDAAIINTAAIVEHDVIVGDYAHVAPGACLAGGARLGLRSHLGVGAIVLDDVTILDDVFVGGGALVNRPLPSGVLAYGVPARVRGEWKEKA